jgi:hypothetical protein
MTPDLPWKKAIEKILRDSPNPLHYNDISQKIIAEKLRTKVGATPALSVHTFISTSIKKEGDNSPFTQIGRGIFTLKETPTGSPQHDHPPTQTEELYEENPGILTSLGMFWRRDCVEWNTSPHLLGIQQLGAAPVNFNKQIGIYLLYDGREVIYVGRATERPLGRRLYEHTLDRLAARWDRFSWFGLLPISEDGQLQAAPTTYPKESIIPALEAALIEALEPRQNRKRGDDLAAVEYLQKPDPAIEKKKVKDQVGKAIDKLYNEPTPDTP